MSVGTASNTFTTSSRCATKRSPSARASGRATTTSTVPRRAVTTTVVTVPTNAGADGPVGEALLRSRWGSLAPADCSASGDESMSQLVCTIDDVHGHYLVDFMAWDGPDGPEYGVTHTSDGDVVTSQGTWPAGAATPRGLVVEYTTTSLGTCIDWSYAGTRFQVSLCSDDPGTARAAAAFIQSQP